MACALLAYKIRWIFLRCVCRMFEQHRQQVKQFVIWAEFLIASQVESMEMCMGLSLFSHAKHDKSHVWRTSMQHPYSLLIVFRGIRTNCFTWRPVQNIGIETGEMEILCMDFTSQFVDYSSSYWRANLVHSKVLRNVWPIFGAINFNSGKLNQWIVSLDKLTCARNPFGIAAAFTYILRLRLWH